MNSVQLIGNLTDNPKITVTANGVTKCAFRLAVPRRYAERQDEPKADFLTIIAWRKLGETCGQYLSKGRKCAVSGSIQTRSYDAKDGSGKRYVTEIIADSVDFIGANPKTEIERKPNDDEAHAFNELDDDDLPF
ncbi:MAG: single-stranded DNA-binding protein [Eubacteriales bacterium]|nr:single-stranded DNA-binding protein [Eubacteriales bacterium]MDD4513748.1 single-stranded DNA-binding protein [Eubacteriales bacterium]